MDCKVIKVILRGFFVIFAAGTGSGRKGCAKRESRREPRAMPGHKVPAPQANSVAARLRPPPEARAGGGSGYDHPSPSIPLPVEVRGKPVAMRPAGLETLAAV